MADLNTPYGTRLCLSGLESRKLLDIFADFHIPHIQVSYYYLKRVFSDPLDFEQYANKFNTVLIDSGTVYHKFRTEEEKTEFINDYSSYIAALNKNAYTACVYEKNSNLEKVCPDEALIYPLDMMLPIFESDIEALFKNLLYIGVSQKDSMYKGGEKLNAYFQYAKRTNALLHAFGTSSKRILGKYPFYSANSSSWRSGSRYLNTYIYEGVGRGMRMYQPKDTADSYAKEKEMINFRKRQYNALNKRPHIAGLIDKDLLLEGNSWEVDKANLAHWMKYQEDLANNPRHKYWLSEDDKTLMIERKRNSHIPTNPTEAHIEQTHIVEDRQYIEEQIEEENKRSMDYYTDKNTDNTIDKEDIEDITDVELVAIEKEKNTDVPASMYTTPNNRINPVDPRLHALRQCEDCSLNDRCKKYTPNGECAYGLPPHITPDPADTPDIIREQAADMLYAQHDRVMQAILEEKLDAAGLNRDLTNNIKLLNDMHTRYMEMINPQQSISVKAKGPGVIDLFKKNK